MKYISIVYRLVYYADIEGQICAPDFSELFNFSTSFNFSSVSYIDDNFDGLSLNYTSAGNYASWPDIRFYDIVVCVEHCNDTLDDPRMVTPSFDSNIELELENDPGVAIYGYETVNFFQAYCIPDPKYAGAIAGTILDDDQVESFESNLQSLTEQISLAVADAQTAYVLFIVRCVVSYT